MQISTSSRTESLTVVLPAALVAFQVIVNHRIDLSVGHVGRAACKIHSTIVVDEEGEIAIDSQFLCAKRASITKKRHVQNEPPNSRQQVPLDRQSRESMGIQLIGETEQPMPRSRSIKHGFPASVRQLQFMRSVHCSIHRQVLALAEMAKHGLTKFARRHHNPCM